jgi:hypothetical protein
MQNFDYNQPTRDTLAGICVEASDSASETRPADTTKQQKSGGQAPPRREDLFGFTQTAEDSRIGAQSNAASQMRKPAP